MRKITLALVFLCAVRAYANDSVYQNLGSCIDHDQVTVSVFIACSDEIGTRTSLDGAMPAYTAALLKLAFNVNVGGADVEVGSGLESLQRHGELQSETLTASSLVTGPLYPQEGVSLTGAAIMIDLPMNRLKVAQRVTFGSRNLDASLELESSARANAWRPRLGGELLSATQFGTPKTGALSLAQDQWIWVKQMDRESLSHGQAHSEAPLGNAVETAITAVSLGVYDTGLLDSDDLPAFERALTCVDQYLVANQAINDHAQRGDINGDGLFDHLDLRPVERQLEESVTAAQSAVPAAAPLAFVWAGGICISLTGPRRRFDAGLR